MTSTTRVPNPHPASSRSEVAAHPSEVAAGPLSRWERGGVHERALSFPSPPGRRWRAAPDEGSGPALPLARAITVVAATLLLAGCALLGRQPADYTIYGIELGPASSATPSGAPVEWQLVVDEPAASEPLRGTRIVLKPGPRAYGIYKGARWTDRAPELVQSLVLEGFERSGRIRGIGRASSSLRGDFLLASDLRAFEARYGDGATAHVELSARLVDSMRNEVVAARVFEAAVPAQGRDVASVVPAFEAAVDEVVAALVAWTLEEGEANAPDR